MRFRLFTLASLLSAILCLAAGVVWVRSNVRRDFLGNFRADSPSRVINEVLIDSNDGCLGVCVLRDSFTTAAAFNARKRRLPDHLISRETGPRRRGMLGPGRWWNALGFAHLRFTSSDGVSTSAGEWITVPYWLICLILAAGPVAWALSFWRRSRRPGPGRCPVCAYDLRASTGRCPECGTPISK